jgi:hypothetical protein
VQQNSLHEAVSQGEFNITVRVLVKLKRATPLFSVLVSTQTPQNSFSVEFHVRQLSCPTIKNFAFTI